MSPSTDTRENREFASELKFLVSPELAEQIRQWACSELLADPNGSGTSGDSYRITSLYLDTVGFDVYHKRGSFGRSKYRIRRYGDSGALFLERKLRTRGLLAKRRSSVPISDIEVLEQSLLDRVWTGFWWQRRVTARELRPVCQISYLRTARVAMTRRGPIRLTLDHDLRASSATNFKFSEDTTPLSLDKVILELKFRCETPVLFKYLVEEFALEPQPFSKYRLAAEVLGLVTPSACVIDPARVPQNA